MASRGRMAQLLADIEKEYDLLLEENAELRARLAKYEKVKDPVLSPRPKRKQGEREQSHKKVERAKASASVEGALTPQARGSFQKRDVWASTRVLEGHRDGVWEVTPCPWSLGRVGTASADRTARVWSLAHNSSTYAHVQYVGHTGSVNSIRFHPKDRLVCTAAGDASVHVWKLPTSMKKYKDSSAAHAKKDMEHQATLWSPLLGSPSLPAPLDNPDPAELSSSPVDLAVAKRLKEKAAAMGELQLGSPSRGELLPDMGVVLEWHEPRIESEEFVINIDTPLMALSGHSGPVVAADWLHGGSCLATVSWDDTVRLWDAEGGAKISEALQGLEEGHYSTNLTTKADSPCVAVSSTDGYVRVWDLRANNQAPAHMVLAHEGSVSSALLAAACDFGLFTAGDDRAFRTWDLRNSERPLHTSRCSSGINRFSASPVTGAIALPLDDRRTKLCDISGNRLGNIRSHDKLGHTAMITCTAWSNDESVVYTSSFSRTRSLIAWTKADRKRKNRDSGF